MKCKKMKNQRIKSSKSAITKQIPKRAQLSFIMRIVLDLKLKANMYSEMFWEILTLRVVLKNNCFPCTTDSCLEDKSG